MTEAAKRPTVVFLHGWLMGPWVWTEAAEKLTSTLPRALLAQPSHGSAGLPVGSTMADWATWLKAQLDERGIERAILVGHSMGGMLALEAAARYPETVAGLCMVSTTDTPWPVEVAQFMVGSAGSLTAWNGAMALGTAQSLLSPNFLLRNPAWLGWWLATVATYDLAGLVSVAQAFATRADQQEVARNFAGPALVIHGTADPVFPIIVGEELAGRLRAPLARIDGAGHAPPLEAPAEFAKALDGFLIEHFGASDG